MASELTITALVPSVDLSQTAAKSREYAQSAKAESTVRAYRSDWRHFTTWCKAAGLTALPAAPETVALYLTALAEVGVKVATMQRRLATISQAHQAAGYDAVSTRTQPLHSVWAGIKRELGTMQKGKSPLRTPDIQAMLDTLPPSLLGIRDRALLLLGFTSAFRRSELVGLDVADAEFTRDGLVITLRRSKTDQEGAGYKVGIPYSPRPDLCPVRSLQAWLEASGISEGAIFRPINRHGQIQPGRLTDQSVALVVKRSALAAGLNASRFAGHSLRAGHVTSAAENGAPERVIMNQTRHRSLAMVRRYIREGNMFKENSAAYLGL